MLEKKNKRKQKEKIRKDSPRDVDAHRVRLSMERKLSAIQKLVDQHEFKSVDELNDFLQTLMSSGELLQQQTAQSPLDRAQELIYGAWEAPNKGERAKLARQALEISPDCADAYVILAEDTAQDIEEQLRIYQAGVEAGERAIGTESFAESVGHFWGILSTRPYMRARAGLAGCLWGIGKREEAIEHYQDMLRLNPSDNQGIRYVLAACLLEVGDIRVLEQLLSQYDEPTAAWLYTSALVAFLQRGVCLESNQRLIEAIKCNPYVPSYLLGKKKLPKRLPNSIGFGDESEAIVYAAEFRVGWFKAKGAISWLESVYYTL